MKDYYVMQHAALEADETTLTVNAAESRRLPVEQVAGLHLLAGYSMTSGVFDLAARHAFPIHMYGYHGTYRGTFLPREGNGAAWPLIRQVQENQDPSLRLQRAHEILAAAWQGMAALLEPFSLCPPPLQSTATLEELRLAEGRVRKEYYALCDTLLPEFWSIVRRERRPPQRPADALLGFVNGLIYAKTAGWIHRAGLDPRIGYLHGDARAANPLALDLAEILKPLLSESVLLTVAASGHERSLTTQVEEGCYLNEKGRKAAIQALEDILLTQSRSTLFDRILTIGRLAELIPTKLHRAIVTGEPVTYPLPTCTLSSSTMQTLKRGRTSVESS